MSKTTQKTTKKKTTTKKKPAKKTEAEKVEANKQEQEQRPFFRKAIEKKKDEWQIVFWFSRDVLRHDPGWKMAGLGLLKIHTFPEEGKMLTRKHYHGVLLRWRYWLPFELGH